MDDTLDRRTFVMGSAGFGMAVPAGSALAGCAASPDAAPPGIDEPSRILEHAEAIGLGSQACELADLDA